MDEDLNERDIKEEEEDSYDYEFALNNELILESLFKNFQDQEELKKLRLVNKTWSNVLAKVIARQNSLQRVIKLNNEYELKLFNSTFFNKKILPYDSFKIGVWIDSDELQKFIKQFGSLTKHLKIGKLGNLNIEAKFALGIITPIQFHRLLFEDFPNLNVLSLSDVYLPPTLDSVFKPSGVLHNLNNLTIVREKLLRDDRSCVDLSNFLSSHLMRMSRNLTVMTFSSGKACYGFDLNQIFEQILKFSPNITHLYLKFARSPRLIRKEFSSEFLIEALQKLKIKVLKFQKMSRKTVKSFWAFISHCTFLSTTVTRLELNDYSLSCESAINMVNNLSMKPYGQLFPHLESLSIRLYEINGYGQPCFESFPMLKKLHLENFTYDLPWPKYQELFEEMKFNCPCLEDFTYKKQWLGNDDSTVCLYFFFFWFVTTKWESLKNFVLRINDIEWRKGDNELTMGLNPSFLTGPNDNFTMSTITEMDLSLFSRYFLLVNNDNNRNYAICYPNLRKLKLSKMLTGTEPSLISNTLASFCLNNCDQLTHFHVTFELKETLRRPLCHYLKSARVHEFITKKSKYNGVVEFLHFTFKSPFQFDYKILDEDEINNYRIVTFLFERFLALKEMRITFSPVKEKVSIKSEPLYYKREILNHMKEVERIIELRENELKFSWKKLSL